MYAVQVGTGIANDASKDSNHELTVWAFESSSSSKERCHICTAGKDDGHSLNAWRSDLTALVGC